eukprot:SAG25_NODE_3334_length_1125_cov_0.845029_1_plen_58_part_10
MKMTTRRLTYVCCALQFLLLGRIGSIELDREAVQQAKKGQEVRTVPSATSVCQPVLRT